MKDSNRYIRQKILPQVGDIGQQRIENASVLVVGCGGLGTSLLPYLASAGIGTIGLVDGDTVSLSNLHRQVLFTEKDIGKSKVTCCSRHLKNLSPNLKLNSYPDYLTVDNAIEIIEHYDIVIDATDRIPARYLINDACVLTNTPFVHAALYRFQSQISVFNFQGGPTYRCLYPTPPVTTQSCDTAGILGTTVAIAAGLQTSEVMKIILNTGDILSGKLLINDFLQNKQSIFNFTKNPNLQIDLEFFEKEHHVNVVDYAFAKAKNSLLLDVRSPWEKPHFSNQNYHQIPIQELAEKVDTLPKNRLITIFCKSGTRSREALGLLRRAGITDISCLKETAQELFEIIKNE